MAADLELLDLLAHCRAATDAAAELIRAGYSMASPSAANLKADGDPVTDVDLAAQRLIVTVLRRAYPTLAVIGEEDEDDLSGAGLAPGAVAAARAALVAELPGWLPTPSAGAATAAAAAGQRLAVHELVVWVDPLDGTRAFLAGRSACWPSAALSHTCIGRSGAIALLQPIGYPCGNLSASGHENDSEAMGL